MIIIVHIVDILYMSKLSWHYKNAKNIYIFLIFLKDENGNTLFLHPIHTYDNSGKVHVETTKNTTAELGFFFDIWGKDFSKDKILDHNVNEEYIIEMTVNDEIVETFENTILEPYIFIDINYKIQN